MQLYPNPTTGILHLEGLPPQASIVLYDVLGRTVLTAAPDGTKAVLDLDLQHLPQGIYFCSIFVENQLVQTNKIGKQ